MTSIEYIAAKNSINPPIIIRVVTEEEPGTFDSWSYAVNAAADFLREPDPESAEPPWHKIATGLGKFLPPDSFMRADVPTQSRYFDEVLLQNWPGSFPLVSLWYQQHAPTP